MIKTDLLLFSITRDKLRGHIIHYDKEPFDPLDPFPANELDINNDFIKRLFSKYIMLCRTYLINIKKPLNRWF